MKRSAKEAIEFLIEHSPTNLSLKQVCNAVIFNETFRTCWGGTKHHHMYEGGLVGEGR